jgi:DNA (cytosine-5)-methyltransferase 1
VADHTILALCAGIGGLEMGVCRAVGGRVVGYVERDAYAAAVLLARMEDSSLEPAPIWCGNLEELDASPFQGVDIITAGFPCQPFSVAGKRNGLQDERWLWPAVARILRDVGPRLVFLENVPGLVRHGLSAILGDLAALGYDAEWDLFRASDVGAPHRRARWFLLAHRDGNVLWPAQGRGEPGWPGEAFARDDGEALAHDAHGCDAELADARGQRLEGQQPAGPEKEATRRGCREWPYHWPPGPDELDRWEAVPAEAQPAVRGVADGLPARMDRLRCLGNAVVPRQAELAFVTLVERLEMRR